MLSCLKKENKDFRTFIIVEGRSLHKAAGNVLTIFPTVVLIGSVLGMTFDGRFFFKSSITFEILS